jgi:hypothetical protein
MASLTMKLSVLLGSSKVVRSGARQAMLAPRHQNQPCRSTNGRYYGFGSGFIM